MSGLVAQQEQTANEILRKASGAIQDKYKTPSFGDTRKLFYQGFYGLLGRKWDSKSFSIIGLKAASKIAALGFEEQLTNQWETVRKSIESKLQKDSCPPDAINEFIQVIDEKIIPQLKGLAKKQDKKEKATPTDKQQGEEKTAATEMDDAAFKQYLCPSSDGKPIGVVKLAEFLSVPANGVVASQFTFKPSGDNKQECELAIVADPAIGLLACTFKSTAATREQAQENVARQVVNYYAASQPGRLVRRWLANLPQFAALQRVFIDQYNPTATHQKIYSISFNGRCIANGQTPLTEDQSAGKEKALLVAYNRAITRLKALMPEFAAFFVEPGSQVVKVESSSVPAIPMKPVQPPVSRYEIEDSKFSWSPAGGQAQEVSASSKPSPLTTPGTPATFKPVPSAVDAKLDTLVRGLTCFCETIPLASDILVNTYFIRFSSSKNKYCIYWKKDDKNLKDFSINSLADITDKTGDYNPLEFFRKQRDLQGIPEESYPQPHGASVPNSVAQAWGLNGPA